MKKGFLAIRELHVPEDVLVRQLERDAVCNTAPLEHPELDGNGTGANMIRLSTEWIAAVLTSDAGIRNPEYEFGAG